ncbi:MULTISPECIES: hypothetical protein [unclassified Rhizobium]|nr:MULTISPECIES: hypothetical protein [unclassified Rhizobium]MBO9125675.1 hypothetical protein [Rhizobium sp. 16-488-2b]MBO9176259.1 hypothetical protein [Rhizobium sp. 16-488-2a]
MTVNTVPVDLTMKHESEWRAIAVPAAAGVRVGVRAGETKRGGGEARSAG